jgi:O-antigen/teichoic acid export membrane protein
MSSNTTENSTAIESERLVAAADVRAAASDGWLSLSLNDPVADSRAGRWSPLRWPAVTWALEPRRFRELSRGFWVLGDQAVVSIANFVTTVLIGRICLQAELGLYALGFSVAVFIAGIPKSLIWSPYTAFYPHTVGDERAKYTGSATLQLVLLALLTAIGLLIAAVVAFILPPDGPLAPLLVVLAPFVVMMLLREHVRRLCLAWLEAREVFGLDTLVSILQIAGLLALAKAGRLSASNAFIVAAFASTVCVGWLWRRGSLIKFDWADFRAHLRQHWMFARWLSAGAVAVLISQAIYRWGLAYFHGWAAVGVLASAQSIIMFANPILLGLANYCGPACATTYARHGHAALYRIALRSSAALLAFMASFFLVIALFGEQIIAVVFGAGYGGQQAVVISIALGLFSEAMLVPSELALMAIHRSYFLFNTAALRLCVTLTLGMFLVWLIGPAGVGYSMLVGNVAALAWQWRVIGSEVLDG